MRIAVSGSRGSVGRALCETICREGHDVLRLVRSKELADRPDRVLWDPASGALEAAKLERVDAVVHLAGAPVYTGRLRWTREARRAIVRSRVDATRNLCAALASLDSPPAVFLCGSGALIYGHSSGELHSEASPPGAGFMASLTQRWEEATAPASTAGMRVVLLRFGMVLDVIGGGLSKLLPFYRLGLGGPIGRGRQYISWISLDDTVNAITYLIGNSDISGPVNIVSPDPIQQREFASTLGLVLGKPAIIPLPSWAVKLLFGMMANELLLVSSRVHPEVLLNSGFHFSHQKLEPALRAVLMH